jgi:hypothetical protein
MVNVSSVSSTSFLMRLLVSHLLELRLIRLICLSFQKNGNGKEGPWPWLAEP